MTMTLDRPAPAAPEPPRRSRRAWIVLALLAAVIVVAFALVTAVVPDRDSGGAVAGTTSTSAMSNAELLQAWATAVPPCDNPIGPSGPPRNKYNLVGGMWLTSGDVAEKLKGVSPRGDAAFVRDRMTRLMVALMQTQSALVDHDNTGTARIDAAGGDPDKEKEVIEYTQLAVSSSRSAFDMYLAHIVDELEDGKDIADRGIDSFFPISGTCR
jgi:hypothetical protein